MADTEAPEIGVGHNTATDEARYNLPSVDQIVADLEAENVDALARTEALVAKGAEFFRIENDAQDSEATEFLVKLRARWKASEADRVNHKATWEDRASAAHAFFKTRILDPLGLAASKEDTTFDPVERTELGVGPRIAMAQTIYKRAKAAVEKAAREAEAARLRKIEEDAAAARRAEEAKARAEAAERQRIADAAATAARLASEALAASAARKRNEANKAIADAAAADARAVAARAEEAARIEAERAESDRIAREEEARVEENRLAEARAGAESAASASLADMSRARGGRGGVSSLRTYIDVRDIDREALAHWNDSQPEAGIVKLAPYFTDKAIRAALDAYADANKATVKAAVRSGDQPIHGAVFFENSKSASRA